jgi:hypothetical protein
MNETLTKLAKAEDVIWRQIGDDVVVIKDNGLATHVFNKTAGYIWELSDGTRGVDNIAAKIYERFEVTPEQAKADVEEAVNHLIKAGILIKIE